MSSQDTTAAGSKAWVEISDSERLPERPVVSVLMCTYNHGPYLSEAIEGVLRQQADFPIELLIGEDCSTDDTREIAVDYQRRYPSVIRVITSDRNVGTHENFKRIFEASRGEFIALCDGDDYWIHPKKLQLQADILGERSEVTAVFGDFVNSEMKRGKWVVDTSRRVHQGLEPHELRGDFFDKCLDGRLRTLTALYRRTVVERIYQKRIPIDRYPFIDMFLVAQAAADGVIERIEGVTGVYRRSPNSATRSTPAHQLFFLQSMREFYANLPTYYPERSVHPVVDLISLDTRICRAAFTAGSTDVFFEVYGRIRRCNHPVPPVLRLAAMIMRVDWLRRMALATRSKLIGLRARFS